MFRRLSAAALLALTLAAVAITSCGPGKGATPNAHPQNTNEPPTQLTAPDKPPPPPGGNLKEK